MSAFCESAHTNEPWWFACARRPAARLRNPPAVLDWPPPTAAVTLLATFPTPPPTVGLVPLAVLAWPPPMIAPWPLAVLDSPPPTMASPPLAMLLRPPATVADSAVVGSPSLSPARLLLPPATV